MKNLFADFREDITVGRDNTPLGEGLWAYRMDGNPGMRGLAKLGGALACCDYLRVDENEHILIEETELGETVACVSEEYNTLKCDMEVRREFVRERVKQENCLKVYGAFLVLCRLKQWEDNTRRVFWLVVSGELGAARALRHWDPEDELESEIKKALMGERKRQSPIAGQLMGAGLVVDVQVMTADELRKKLSHRIAPRP